MYCSGPRSPMICPCVLLLRSLHLMQLFTTDLTACLPPGIHAVLRVPAKTAPVSFLWFCECTSHTRSLAILDPGRRTGRHESPTRRFHCTSGSLPRFPLLHTCWGCSQAAQLATDTGLSHSCLLMVQEQDTGRLQVTRRRMHSSSVPPCRRPQSSENSGEYSNSPS